MDLQISKSAQVPGQVEFRESPSVSIHAEASSNGLSESHRLSQSKLRPHQIFPPRVTPHSRSPGSEAEEVRAVEMVVYKLMNPAPSSTTLLYHTLVQDGAVPPGFQQEFEGLAPAIESGTSREARCHRLLGPCLVAELLRLFVQEESCVEIRRGCGFDQLVQAATVQPRKPEGC